jgi:hypothetical protein
MDDEARPRCRPATVELRSLAPRLLERRVPASRRRARRKDYRVAKAARRDRPADPAGPTTVGCEIVAVFDVLSSLRCPVHQPFPGGDGIADTAARADHRHQLGARLDRRRMGRRTRVGPAEPPSRGLQAVWVEAITNRPIGVAVVASPHAPRGFSYPKGSLRVWSVSLPEPLSNGECVRYRPLVTSEPKAMRPFGIGPTRYGR